MGRAGQVAGEKDAQGGGEICEIGREQGALLAYRTRSPQKRWPNTAILRDLCDPSTRAHTRSYIVPIGGPLTRSLLYSVPR